MRNRNGGGFCDVKLPLSLIMVLAAGAAFPWPAVAQQTEPADPESDVSIGDPQTAPATAATVPDGKDLNVIFDTNEDGVVIVEANGKRYRIDSANKTVAEISATAVPAANDGTDPISSPETVLPDNGKPTVASESSDGGTQDDISPYYFEPGDEPYDYRIINVPTPKMVPKGTWNISFSHRFTQPIHPISRSGRGLLGFDSFSVSSFGIAYGITDRLYVNASRNPICIRGLCRVVEVGAGYHWLDQNKKSPISFSTYGSVEGNENFSEDYTINAQAMISRRLGERVYLFFSPALHLFSNGGRRFDPRPGDFFPPATAAENFRLAKHGASFGFGTTVMITPTLLGLFEFTPRTGFKLGRVIPVLDQNLNIVDFDNISEPSIGFGIQKNIGNHSFALTFSNTQTTTTSRYNSSNLLFPPKRLVIGFNLFRRF